MFCTMFDLITIDYIMEHIEFKDKHRNPSKRGEILPMFEEILLIYAAANIELRNCEIFTQSR